jgi:DNA-binding response OmpR family regulator
MKRILFADNDTSFLETRAGFLSDAGYEILLAQSPAEAEQKLSQERVHLAVLDIRLENDLDERDLSGLVLAKKHDYRHIPKIILTRYPTYENVREALGDTVNGLPPAVRFVAKQEGSQALVQAVNESFKQYIHINWKLFIKMNETNPLTFRHLLDLIQEDSGLEKLSSREDELEDLFRSLFFDMNQIRVSNLLWKRNARAAVTVFAFAEGKKPEAFLVVYGGVERVQEEVRHYQEFAPKAPGLTSTVLYKSSESTRFAANAYVLASADLENLRSFAELYRTGPDKVFRNALENLFQNVLTAWHQDVSIADESRNLGQWYLQRLGLTGEHIDESSFESCILHIIHQMPALGVDVELSSGRINVSYGGLLFSYKDPTPMLSHLARTNQPALLENVPGMLSGESILADSEGGVWLTDFAEAGLGPANWNMVALEASMRFDWIETNRIEWLHEMERSLVEGDFNRPDVSEVEQPLRKTVRAIQLLRRLASRPVTSNPTSHNLGILCHAAKRLADHNILVELTQNERIRLVNILLAAAIIYDKFCSGIGRANSSLLSGQAGIKIDKENRAVWVDGARIVMRGQSFDLLCYLQDRANQLCKRDEIIENVFKEVYREDDSQINKVNTAIRRLREKIEVNPDRPRFVITEPGGGYRLVTKQQK